MIYRKTRLSLAWMAGLLLIAAGVSAEQSEDIGDHVVHYNTMSTMQLPTEVARAHDLQRSSSRALLNVAVLKKSDEGELPTPVTAEVTASAINLTGQRRNIRMREITEEDAIYYIGTFRIHDEETLDFTVRVTPAHSDQDPGEIRFRQQFFID